LVPLQARVLQLDVLLMRVGRRRREGERKRA